MAENCALSSAVGLLAHLSIDELKDVLNDDDKFDNITKDANIAVSYLLSLEFYNPISYFEQRNINFIF